MRNASLPTQDTWLAELRGIEDPFARDARLKEMQAQTRASGDGNCGSLATANGLPCRRACKAGYSVCPTHGSRAPQTITKAERLLAFGRMPAIEGIVQELEQADQNTCDTCGYPNLSMKYRKHIAAIRFKLLDRTGFGPRATLDVTAKRLADGETPRDVAKLTDAQFVELSAILDLEEAFWRKVNAAAPRPALAGYDGALDGEVVRAEGDDA